MKSYPNQFLIVALIIFFSSSVQILFAQTKGVEKSVKDFSHMEEKAYLHIDKPYYYAGEKIWFKAYMNYRIPELIDSLSRVLYVELIDPEKKIVQTRIVFIDAGSGEGNVNLPENLTAGNYFIRAYTTWMLNYQTENIYTRVVPILVENDRPAMVGVSEVVQEGDIKLKLRTRNEFYKARSRIDVSMELRDQSGNPVYADLSVAITDTNQVVEVPEDKTILSGFQFIGVGKANETTASEKYKVEKGINVSGQYTNKKKQPARSSFFMAEETTNKLLPVETDKAGKFKVEGLLFYDSSSIAFQTLGKKKKFEGEIELFAREIPTTANLIEATPFSVVKTETVQRKKLTLESFPEDQVEKVIMEEPVEEKQVINKSYVPNSYGKPDFSISGEEIVKSSRTSLMDALMGRVPGLTAYNGYLRLGGPSNFQGAATTEPMLIVDGTQFTGGGSDSNYGRLRQINPEIVDRVDVIKYGGAAIFGTRGGNGIIIVTTKNADTMANGAAANRRDEFALYKPVVGFSLPETFVAPDYSRIANREAYPDFRSTIYWDPFLATDNLGNINFSFYAAGEQTRYKVVIEGVTATGKPIRHVFYLDVIK